MNIAKATQQVVKLSRADDVIAIANHVSSANLRWALNTTTTNGAQDENYLTVISVIKRRVGVAAGSLTSTTSLAQKVRQSEKAAQNLRPAEDYMPLLKGIDSILPTASGQSDIDHIGLLGNELSRSFAAADKDGLKLFGYAMHSTATTHLANSRGLRKAHRQINGYLGLNAKSTDFKKSSWLGQTAKDFRSTSVKSLYQQLLTRHSWAQKNLKLPAGHYEVILSPSAVADLLLYAYVFAGTAREADEGRSAFSQPGGGSKVGHKIAAPSVSIYSDPVEPNIEVYHFLTAAVSSSYESIFDNGLDLKKTYWIRDGKLENLITPRFWAKKTQRPAVPFIHNLIFDHRQGPTAEEMIKTTKRGLFVNCLWYIREVDPQNLLLTGLTRDGVYLIDNGQIKGGVNNFRFNVSPIEMLSQILEIGKAEPTLPREWGSDFSNVIMPPLRIKDFNMSSVSPGI